MPDLIPAPVFDGDDLEELAQWLADSMMADPSVAGVIGGGGRAAALRFARQRAAQLLGMTLDRASGAYVPAKRAPYRIAEDLREKARDLVSKAIERGDSVATLNAELRPLFDQVEGRATMIAATESATSMNAGSLAGYADLDVETVDVIDGEGCLPDGHDRTGGALPPEPDHIGVQEDRLAHGQIWTLDEAAEHLVGHPFCKRVFSPRP